MKKIFLFSILTIFIILGCSNQNLPNNDSGSKNLTKSQVNCNEYHGSLLEHLKADRAYKSNLLAPIKATGSNEILGYSFKKTVTLREPSSGIFEKGHCRGIGGIAVKMIDGSLLPHTENIVITLNGRMFVASAAIFTPAAIYEITKNQDGTLSAAAVVPGVDKNNAPCAFTGLSKYGNTLFATCQNFLVQGSKPNLIRVKVGKSTIDEIKYAEITMNQPNGMALDLLGNLYITDTYAMGGASVVKIKGTFKKDFNIEQIDFITPADYPAGTSQLFPNGIQIIGNTLYFADAIHIFKVKLKLNGSAGALSILYSLPSTFEKIIDDFAIVKNKLAISVIPLPDAVVRKNGYIQIINRSNGQELKQIYAENRYEPSSVVFDRFGFFEKNALYIKLSAIN